ncbi:MAG: GntR family transcriptional regulator [Carbonactinosporaceae bacterium]
MAGAAGGDQHRRQHERQRKYQRIAEDLRAAIRAGEYLPGDRLPGENVLMERYAVARMTARAALQQLQAEGLVVARKGAGVYVREFRLVIRSGVQRLSARQWGSGRSVWAADDRDREVRVDQLRVYEAEAPERVLQAFESEPPLAVVVRDRRYVMEGKPVMVAVSYLPVDLAAGTPMAERDTGPGGVYARLKELGHPPVHFREDTRARMPRHEEAGRLALPAGTPVVDVVRTAYAASGRVVEVAEMTAESAYVFRYEFDA